MSPSSQAMVTIARTSPRLDVAPSIATLRKVIR
jgi:hypothetical protein